MYSSEIMLSNENKLNKINPYMDGLIAWTKPYRYEKQGKPKEEPGPWSNEPIFPSTVDFCKIEKEIEPFREIQADFQTGFIDQLLGNVMKPKDSYEVKLRGSCKSGGSNYQYLMITIIAIIVLFLLVKR